MCSYWVSWGLPWTILSLAGLARNGAVVRHKVHELEVQELRGRKVDNFPESRLLPAKLPDDKKVHKFQFCDKKCVDKFLWSTWCELFSFICLIVSAPFFVCSPFIQTSWFALYFFVYTTLTVLKSIQWKTLGSFTKIPGKPKSLERQWLV